MKMYKILVLALVAPVFVACGGSAPTAQAPQQRTAAAKKADEAAPKAYERADNATGGVETAAAAPEKKEEWCKCSIHPDARFRCGEACPICGMHGGGMH